MMWANSTSGCLVSGGIVVSEAVSDALRCGSWGLTWNKRAIWIKNLPCCYSITVIFLVLVCVCVCLQRHVSDHHQYM